MTVLYDYADFKYELPAVQTRIAMTKQLIIVSLFMFNVSFCTILNVPDDYPSIQAGIDASVDGDTVLVMPGIYVENINFGGKNILLTSNYIFDQNLITIEETVIDGNQNGSVVTFENGEDSTAVLLGFSIFNGDGNYTNLDAISFHHLGGGILCYQSSPKLQFLKVYDNNADNGGGIFCHTSNLELSYVEIYNNSAGLGGGVFIKNNSNLVMDDVLIFDNDAYNGGGFYTSNSYPILNNVVITNNFGDFGGGIISFFSQIIFTHVEISQNVAQSGGGISTNNSDLNLINITIADNYVSSYGGGIYCGENNRINIINSILWSNNEQTLYGTFDDNVIINYSDVESGWEGEGNVNTDPQFVDPENGNYQLALDSPCIDAGDPDSNLDDDGSISDMGTYSYYQFCYDSIKGDVNVDENINVFDIMIIIQCIVNSTCPDPIIDECTYWSMDFNDDNEINILDILLIVNIILG